MKIIIVDKISLEIKGSYECEQLLTEYHTQVCYCAGALCEPQCQHLALPEGLLEDEAKAELQSEEIVLVQDQAKVQVKLNRKLDELRSARAPKLAEVDLMVNDLALDESAHTLVEIKAYRLALKNVTEAYKNEDGSAKAGIASLDLATFTWPSITE
jgi:hypothetical protein